MYTNAIVGFYIIGSYWDRITCCNELDLNPQPYGQEPTDHFLTLRSTGPMSALMCGRLAYQSKHDTEEV